MLHYGKIQVTKKKTDNSFEKLKSVYNFTS